MQKSVREANLNQLNADITKSRREMDALAGDLKKLADWNIVHSNGNNGTGAWSSLWHTLNQAGAHGKKVAKGLAQDVERHPLIASLAALGLGFVTARLLYRRADTHSRR